MMRRRQGDRRRNEGRQRFPCLDSSGAVVEQDRRRQAERRLSSIEAEWEAMACESGHAHFDNASRWSSD
jgi:hypothetical protein